MSEGEKHRLIVNIAASLSRVSKKDIVKRSIENFRKADPEFGDRLEQTMGKRRGSVLAAF
jgi:catalase